jgi:hypothetical protein
MPSVRLTPKERETLATLCEAAADYAEHGPHLMLDTLRNADQHDFEVFNALWMMLEPEVLAKNQITQLNW